MGIYKENIQVAWHLMFKIEYCHYFTKNLALAFSGDHRKLAKMIERLYLITQLDENVIIKLMMEKAISLNNVDLAKALLDRDKELNQVKYKALIPKKSEDSEESEESKKSKYRDYPNDLDENLLIFYRDLNNFTLLQKAVNYNHPKLVELFLYCMKNVLQPPRWRSHLSFLIGESINKRCYLVNAVDRDGYSALHTASYMGYMHISGLLSADPNIVLFENDVKFTPLDYAEQCHFKDIHVLLTFTKKTTDKTKENSFQVHERNQQQQNDLLDIRSCLSKGRKGDVKVADLSWMLWASIHHNQRELAYELIHKIIQPNDFETVFLEKITKHNNSPQESIFEYLATNNEYQILKRILEFYKDVPCKLSSKEWEHYFCGHLSPIHRAGGSFSGECMLLFLEFSNIELKKEILSIAHQCGWSVLHEAVTSLVESTVVALSAL